ncbi:cytolethal distending toxin subunit CdtB [Canicola haemoglobinophilus]|uniref:Cytolethal distending toxin protein B n=1 Tax=Canicola haemoglobinophilus TaxID=733 RepID=A0A1V4B073_9PAST|nr:cytolethal distending toxin subunit B family protein [Canicola haemoglobinophilus]OOR99495.1 cytolethal distending toxin subunit CdtB [Canicola haemoglobinophilus]STO54829.1 cytolethal distending toxin protein B [Canicola haemoglobinophilus]STO59721.1 cytolethal distending toxin protein B [Canicola haemoglobinophilus]STO69600.1 cytolethal distending toxin protein B [Canicola haemoglobinophilus]
MLKRFKQILILSLSLLSLNSFAALNNYNVATWNLQGSSASSESKWNINVRQLITGRDSADILMVQEAGSLPLSAMQTQRVIQPVGVGIPINEYVWNLGTTTRPNNVYIYYSRLDVGANRVNLAIVSRVQAEEVFVISPTTTVLQARPAIGIRIGNDVFFSVHALSSGGSDAISLINNVYDFFNQDVTRRRYSWMLVGDFNRSPTNLQSALSAEPRVNNNTLIVAPTEPTHRSGSILDYAVIHNATGEATQLNLGASIMFNQVRSQITSDHYPVSFIKDRKK